MADKDAVLRLVVQDFNANGEFARRAVGKAWEDPDFDRDKPDELAAEDVFLNLAYWNNSHQIA